MLMLGPPEEKKGARRQGGGQKFRAAMTPDVFACGAQGQRKGVLSKETMHAQGTKTPADAKLLINFVRYK